MATTTKKRKLFTIVAKVEIEVTIDVGADNLLAAVTDSQNLKVEDFITTTGDMWSSDNFRISAVLEA